MKDLISRQAAIDVLSLGKEILSRVLDDMDVVGVDREKYSYGLELIESNINDIEELPPAQPKRPKGKWITQEFGSWAECSECHELYDIPIACSNFCPNCGADMRGD